MVVIGGEPSSIMSPVYYLGHSGSMTGIASLATITTWMPATRNTRGRRYGRAALALQVTARYSWVPAELIAIKEGAP